MFDRNLTTFDMFDQLSEKVNLKQEQMRLWYCNSDDLPEEILASSVEILISDYFQDRNEIKMIIQEITDDDENQEIEGNVNLMVYIKFFFSENLLRHQKLNKVDDDDDDDVVDDDLLKKQLQVPLQYLRSVTVKANDKVNCLVPLINKEIGLLDDTKLDAFQFELSGNVKKISLDRSFISNDVSNGSILAFQVNSEKIQMNSLKIDFSFEFEDEFELFKYDNDSDRIHESLKSIENFVRSDYGRCYMKFIEMRNFAFKK